MLYITMYRQYETEYSQKREMGLFNLVIVSAKQVIRLLQK